ncbi:hypothetical protein [Nocardioides houyundeii]|uniref:hypothetical protein n=1 Tax=Nocardioides houyundeii TaxID=2045452 RepID=UPI000DF21512|nr:hypothetical protein [Nocardioides houyundeii]
MSEEEPRPLLPTLAANSKLDAMLRESLRTLRDHAEDEAVRRRIDAVLRGEESLRTLARDDEFGAFVAPLASRGYGTWDAMDPDQRERLVESAREELDPWREA